MGKVIEKLPPCQFCGMAPEIHGAQDMGYLLIHSCKFLHFRVSGNEMGDVVNQWRPRRAPTEGEA